MILDYIPKTGVFTVTVPRSDKELVRVLMKDDGLDFSTRSSTPNNAVLFTREPYAAATYALDATPAAFAQIAPIVDGITDSWRKDSEAHIKCPMDKEPWAFQRAGVAYALRRNNTLFGDQPGLGKTEEAILFCNEIGAKRVLVACPASIRLQWATRIREWSTMRWPYHVYPIIHGRHGVHPSAHWTIVSYDLGSTEAIGRALSQHTYDAVILDEIHYLKTVDSGRTRAFFGDHTGFCRRELKDDKDKHLGWENLFRALSTRAGAVIGLSGTPLPNRPREAYTIARGLCFDSIDWMSEKSFTRRFNPSARLEGTRKDGSVYEYTREEVGRANELQNRLRANFMVRRLKRDVMPQLKLPIYDVVQVDKTAAVKQALEAESLLDIDPETFSEADSIRVEGDLAVVRRLMGMAIAPQVASYADMILDGGEEKIVIFAWHISVLDILQERLAKWGVLRVDGSTSAVQKQKRVQEFITNRDKHVMLGNTLSLGTGTDGLQQVAAHALLAEPDWVAGNNEQAIDRLDRGGQTRTVLADLFVAPGSLLEKILAIALRKRHNVHRALDERAA